MRSKPCLYPVRTITAGLLLIACQTAPDGKQVSMTKNGPFDVSALDFYEHSRIRDLTATADCRAFTAQTAIKVTQRDDAGQATEGTLRVLVDHPSRRVYVLSQANQWGKTKTDADKLRPVPGTPYYEGRFRGLRHGQQYRLEVDGEQLLDPSAVLFTSKKGYEALEESGGDDTPYLNSVFWDFDRPGAYKRQATPVDLRERPIIIGESEVMALVRKFRVDGHEGPRAEHETYRFVAESGVISKLQEAGYNAIEFLPFNTSIDDEHWHFRYQVYGLFAPDSRYGTPDDFARMIDAFNGAGIAVIMDAVVGHYPFEGNTGVRSLGNAGLHKWRKGDGKRLFGEVKSPWNTYRYDYANPFVRQFLSDAVVSMICRYGIGGVRFDNLDGIRLYEGPGGGGPEFLRELSTSIRRVQPATLLIGEMFFGANEVLQRLDEGGLGIDFRTHSTFFDFIKDNLLKSTGEVDLARLRGAIRDPFDWREAARVNYVTNHDEAANRRDGATGAYVASLLGGGGWYFVERKTKAFASLAMLTSPAYLDMPQLRLLQEGTFNDQSFVNWGVLAKDSQKHAWQWFADLSKVVGTDPAFAFQNFWSDTEHHVDTSYGWRVISLQREDRATGRRYLAVINLGHQELSNYRLGASPGSSYHLVLDSDDRSYGGSGKLSASLTDGQVAVTGPPLHAEKSSVTLPFVAPYGVLLLVRDGS